MYQRSKHILVFRVEQVFLELFQFAHGTLFWTPCSYKRLISIIISE